MNAPNRCLKSTDIEFEQVVLKATTDVEIKQEVEMDVETQTQDLNDYIYVKIEEINDKEKLDGDSISYDPISNRDDSNMEKKKNKIVDGKKTVKIKKKKKIFNGECDYCNKTFDSKQMLIKDMTRHFKEQTCKTCLIFFRNYSQFHEHVKTFHNVKQIIDNDYKYVYDCNICNKSFKQSGCLKRHERIHFNERPYVCNVCDKSFIQISGLITHQRIHTKERPYECNICSKTFNQSGSLKSHLRIHTNERPYVCTVCNKNFIQISSLKSHERVHKKGFQFACDLCDEVFTESRRLQFHRHGHTNKPYYNCDLCEKRFVQCGTLRRHQRTHTNNTVTPLKYVEPILADDAEANTNKSLIL